MNAVPALAPQSQPCRVIVPTRANRRPCDYRGENLLDVPPLLKEVFAPEMPTRPPQALPVW
jgi:hypothetical protein